MVVPRHASTTATWACPHCGARQAETGRCWVCHRSSTCCATCANFRSSLVGGVGYCALDRARTPLRGDELRGCWEAPPSGELINLGGLPTAEPSAHGTKPDPAADGRAARRWVVVEPSSPKDR